MQKKIAVVVVTYNRLILLKECLNSLQKQTYKPNKIFVINNDSNDGTTYWLNEQKDIDVTHQANLGGSGGFYTGIKLAYEQGFDFIWVMDDDVEPDVDCLEKLMHSFMDFGNEYDVLLPDRFYDAGRNKRWRYGTKFNFTNPLKNMGVGKGICSTDNLSSKILPIVAFPFEGPIFKREVIEKIGNVEKDFFIIHDDTDYSIRTINAGFKIGVVVDSILIKKIFVDSKKGLRVDFKLYYLIRNNIILDRKFGNFFFALTRSTVMNIKLMLVFFYNDIKSGEFQTYRSINPIFKGTLDGFKWKF
jgi:GT2 family glycosyltransferase